MSSTAAPLLVSPRDLQGGPPRVFLDASWHMPGAPHDARAEFAANRLPGARFLDLDAVAAPHALGLKHMLPSGAVFAQSCESLGIAPTAHVVLYDTHGVFSAPRALYMFRAFGHANSSVLDGGLPRWAAEGFPVEDGAPAEPAKARYPVPELDANVVRGYEQVVANSAHTPTADPAAELVLDARARGRWLGTDPEPRPGLSSGHIPHSFSLPFNLFLSKHSSGYTTFRTPDELEAELRDVLGPEFFTQAVNGERTVVTSCGSGMTAAVLWLGLQRLGVKKIGLYDESWTGYAMRKESVIEKAQ